MNKINETAENTNIIQTTNIHHNDHSYQQKKSHTRESGIELLKILAMFLIVMYHVTQAICYKNEALDSSYLLDLSQSTNNIQQLILSWMMGWGPQGNIIFFVCSAWFLLDSKRVNKKKILYSIANVWIINVFFVCIFKLGGWFDISTKQAIRCLFPVIFQLNWYITFYLLFYSIHLMLNKVIFALTQKQLLTISITMLFLYFGIDYLLNDDFMAYNELVLFISIYFIIAYMKLYLSKLSNSKKVNIFGLIIGILGTIFLTVLTNILGNHISVFSDKLMHWHDNNSPFMLLIAICLFNLFRQKKFHNNFVNYISSLTLLIYIIHDNVFIGKYVRPSVWIFIHEKLGYNYVLIEDLCFALILFIVATIISLIYVNIIQKLVYKICDFIYIKISKIYNKSMNYLLKIQ